MSKKKQNMEEIDEVMKLRVALAMCGVVANDMCVDTIITCQKKIREKGDEFDLKDACKIQVDMKNKYAEKEPKP